MPPFPLVQAVEARRSERLWRERMDAFNASLEQQKEDTLDITADMMRQYKAMQEQLLKKVSDLEAENRALKQTVGGVGAAAATGGRGTETPRGSIVSDMVVLVV